MLSVIAIVTVLAVGAAGIVSISIAPAAGDTLATALESPTPGPTAVRTTGSARPVPAAPGTTPATPGTSSPGTSPPGPSPTPGLPSSSPGAGGIVAGSVGRSSLALVATYDASLSIHWTARTIAVSEIIRLRNASGGPVDRVDLNSVAARLGSLRLRRVAVDGRSVRATVDDQTIGIPLGGVLPEGASTRIDLAFSATVRSSVDGSNWLFTRANGILDLYRWLPWVSRPTPFDRPNHGDPFVTPSSPRVTVRIRADRPLVYATTGGRIATDGPWQTFRAERVRDFAILAAPDFRVASGSVGSTTVRVVYRPGQPGSTLLTWAKRALSRMSALVGTYPYDVYTVAQSAGGYGMESPTLSWLPYGLARSRVPYLVSHETAHQWFYGLVGNDQARAPFADEAAADYLARWTLAARRASRCPITRLDLSIYRYSAACYYEVVYIQGGNFLDGLRRRMGTSAFWRAVRAYVAENRDGLVGETTLLEALDAATASDLRPAIEARFPSTR